MGAASTCMKHGDVWAPASAPGQSAANPYKRYCDDVSQRQSGDAYRTKATAGASVTEYKTHQDITTRASSHQRQNPPSSTSGLNRPASLNQRLHKTQRLKPLSSGQDVEENPSKQDSFAGDIFDQAIEVLDREMSLLLKRREACDSSSLQNKEQALWGEFHTKELKNHLCKDEAQAAQRLEVLEEVLGNVHNRIATRK